MGETLWIRKAIESELDKSEKEDEREGLLKLLEEIMAKGKDVVAHE